MKLKRETNKILTRKIVDSGDFIEVYDYFDPRFVHTKVKKKGFVKNLSSPKLESIIFNQKRAKKTIKRLIALNFTENSKFFTLTFAENITDISYCKDELNKFFKRLRYYLGFSFPYVYVIEFQKRGSVHFHVVMDTPFIPNKTLFEIWRHGFVRINKVYNKEHLVNYVSKYMSKNYIDNRMRGFRSYTCSGCLKRPLVLFDTVESKVASNYLKSIGFNGVVDFSNRFDKVPHYGLDYWYILKDNIDETRRIINFFKESKIQQKLKSLFTS